MKVLVPAYGRDYKNRAEVVKAYQTGKDFILRDHTSRWDGKPCSGRDFPYEEVSLRYNSLRRVTTSSFPK